MEKTFNNKFVRNYDKNSVDLFKPNHGDLVEGFNKTIIPRNSGKAFEVFVITAVIDKETIQKRNEEFLAIQTTKLKTTELEEENRRLEYKNKIALSLQNNIYFAIKDNMVVYPAIDKIIENRWGFDYVKFGKCPVRLIELLEKLKIEIQLEKEHYDKLIIADNLEKEIWANTPQNIVIMHDGLENLHNRAENDLVGSYDRKEVFECPALIKQYLKTNIIPIINYEIPEPSNYKYNYGLQWYNKYLYNRTTCDLICVEISKILRFFEDVWN